jgi:SAM-dependent methyltransferase
MPGSASRTPVDYKAQAIMCWSHVPCGSRLGRGVPGTRPYFESLLKARHQYAPWMANALDYRASKGLRVLDVGCGQGVDLANFATAGATAVGIDLTPRHVELARSHLSSMSLRASVVEGDAEALPFAEGSFDRVVSNGVLHHTPNFDRALDEIARVLRSGGDLRMIVYNRHSLHYYFSQLFFHGVLQGRLWREGWDIGRVISYAEDGSAPTRRPLVSVYTRRSLVDSLKRHGFVDIRVGARHFRLEDLPFAKSLQRFERIQRGRLIDRIGEKAGWFLVAVATRA